MPNSSCSPRGLWGATLHQGLYLLLLVSKLQLYKCRISLLTNSLFVRSTVPSVEHAVPIQQLTFQEGSQSHWDPAAAFCGQGTELSCGKPICLFQTKQRKRDVPPHKEVSQLLGHPLFGSWLFKEPVESGTTPAGGTESNPPPESTERRSGHCGGGWRHKFPSRGEAVGSASPTSCTRALISGTWRDPHPHTSCTMSGRFSEERPQQEGNGHPGVFAEDQTKDSIPCKTHCSFLLPEGQTKQSAQQEGSGGMAMPDAP